MTLDTEYKEKTNIFWTNNLCFLNITSLYMKPEHEDNMTCGSTIAMNLLCLMIYHCFHSFITYTEVGVGVTHTHIAEDGVDGTVFFCVFFFCSRELTLILFLAAAKRECVQKHVDEPFLL